LRARTTSIGLAPFVAKLNQPLIAVAGSLRAAFIKFTPTVVNFPLSINLSSLPGIEPKVRQYLSFRSYRHKTLVTRSSIY